MNRRTWIDRIRRDGSQTARDGSQNRIEGLSPPSRYRSGWSRQAITTLAVPFLWYRSWGLTPLSRRYSRSTFIRLLPLPLLLLRGETSLGLGPWKLDSLPRARARARVACMCVCRYIGRSRIIIISSLGCARV